MKPEDFAQLPLPPKALENLAQMGYTSMTPIQQQSLPVILQGRDIIAQAQTGSGKTAAFGIGLLEKINPRFFGVQGLVLCPTRELATQVATELRKLARYLDNIKIVSICGGQPIGPQIGSLEHGAHIVIGTPGRLRDHLRKQTLNLESLHTLILDEADRMLDMGFEEDIRFIIGATPDKRQTLLFSATYPDSIVSISAEYQFDPLRVSVESQHDDTTIEQAYITYKNQDKTETLAALLQHFAPEAAIIFCNTKQTCSDMVAALRNYGLKSLALHGDLEQRDRDQVLIRFSNGSCRYLFATDVAARGLDIDSVDLVINADLPADPAIYTHRIGRTGRAGRQGMAISLCSDRETYRLKRIEELQKQEIKALKQLASPSPDKLPEPAKMTTLCIAGGRKDKLRPGDILGALTASSELTGDVIGKINVTDFSTYVAIERAASPRALELLKEGKIKGRSFKIRRL
ncbi:ATP-dependent RNA helicase DbpA [Nitrincola tibetensis]|uniref:ATP-dependent RNA helicase DbpA n=1 Tax=Nitrincola tibetensis TaxID=2219697 RepID=A0A364NPI6_9GAMM|nr:ATP-dependent RNA helicase DbpA [Nitrincola tibetensis]RAU19006.1 ATP-dependent RNA helicase DbpA [Nitrincola tibetensis]